MVFRAKAETCRALLLTACANSACANCLCAF